MNYWGKSHPFLTLCLSMAFVSIATEMVNFTDGRPSFTGNLAMKCVVAGLVLGGLCELVHPQIYGRWAKLVPLFSAALCMALPCFASTPLYIPAVILHGTFCGIFFTSSLTEYLCAGPAKQRLVNIGISAGIYTTSVYPFGVAYTLLTPVLPENALRFGSYIFLCVMAILIALLRIRVASAESSNLPAPPILGKKGSITFVMLILIVLFTVLNHILLSGVLEQNGGTLNAPWVYFLNVAMRLPMGFLMGWFAHKGKWYYSIGLPLGLMIIGCAVSLFAGNTPLGDYAIIGIFNCGGAAFVMLVHVLGMQAALWMKRRALMASLGALLHFTLTSFMTPYTLGLSPAFFGHYLRQPLSFTVIALSIPLFFFIMLFLVNHKLMEFVNAFFFIRAEPGGAHKGQPETGPVRVEEMRFSAFERKIASLLIDGLSQGEIARRLHMPASQVKESLNAIRGKVSGADDVEPVIAAIVKQYNLTRRETDMLRCLRKAMGNAEIAAELILSEETVKWHVRNLLKKLSLPSRLEVAAWVEAFGEGNR